MANDVMQRPLFAGPLPPGGDMPMPPAMGSSVGTGITSGLVDPAQEQLQAEAGFARLAGTMGNILESVDNASSPEEAMNAVRGDQAPLSERRRELAQFVGEKDANATPVAVLAFLQPTFTIMEIIQKQAPQGGISDVMPQTGGGESTENFNLASSVQAPGAEEAMMRMAAGEQPVRRQLGTPPTGENVPGNPYGNIPTNSLMSPPSSMSFQYLPNNTTLPVLTRPDPNALGEKISQYSGLIDKLPISAGGITDPSEMLKRNQTLFADYLTKPRSREDILAEQDAYFGDDIKADAETQAYLALAKYGSQIAQTPGTLLQALVKPAGELAGDLSKVAASQSAAKRKSKELAYTTSAAEKQAEQAQKLNIALKAVEEAGQNERSFEATKNAFKMKLAEAGMDAAIAETKAVNDNIYKNFAANQYYSGLGTLNFAKKDDKGNFSDLKTGWRTADGIYTYTKEGKFVKMPPDYVSIPDAAATALLKQMGSSGLIDDAKPQKFIVPDKNTKTGYIEKSGFFSPSQGFFLSKDGKLTTGSIERLPDGWLMGDINEKVKSSDVPDQAGRIHTTVTGPDGVTRTFLSSVEPPGGGKRIGIPVAYNLELPVYKDVNVTENGVTKTLKKHVSGNPMVRELLPTGEDISTVSSDRLAELRGKVEANVYTLEAGEELLKQMKHIIGPSATLKSFASENVAALLPKGTAPGLIKWAQTDAGRTALLNFERTIQRTESLSSRYAMGEQEINKKLVPQLGAFKDPEAAVVQLQEYLRTVQNRLADARAIIDPEKTPRLHLDRIPTGTQNDPFIFYDPQAPNPRAQWDYLNDVAARGVDLSGRKIAMTAGQAQAIGLPKDVWMRNNKPAESMIILDLSKLRSIRSNK